MNFPENLRYTKTHEWIVAQGVKVKVGVTEYAQKEISDVVFVELPKKGLVVQQGKTAAVVESVKAAFDIYAPASGKVTDANTTLEGNPGLVNQSPYGDGWMFELELSNPAELNTLMTAQQYGEFIHQSAKH
ncbi:MAG TPA: glycine cleavage system protein GcvH [Candidatus Omnitrophota bacterium]|nr:glycine cleavage system protein GcvH [Candidatus Omnitrophota bacterium]HPS36748.1 glycine cleavage system protein GcvH [Candidatus Omnitrophota bacterium]